MTNQVDDIQDFLYGDRREIPNVYNAHRTSHTFKYKLKNNEIECDQMQIEIDLTLESRGRITVFEAKNKFSEDFAKYQIYLSKVDSQSIKIMH